MTEPVIDHLEEVWRSIIDLGEQLTESEWKLPTDLPHWTVQDNLSHIIGTERMMRGEPSPEVTPASTDHLRNPIGEMNELWVESRRPLSGAAVLDEFRTVAAERLADYRALTPAELDALGPTPVGEAPFREYIAVRVMDSWAHEQDMRRAVGRPGHLEGPAVALAIGRVTKAMPMVVGKRAGAPDGSSVVFVVTGTEGCVVPVVVSGRAAVADTAPDDATVELRLDVETYTALGMGRLDPAAALADGRITIEGDEALGRSVVGAMNFMI
ncbi:MAG: maleylpyruvate isomerase family mycothiol-dependent enzyme [Acidimicrobiales bacterium]